MEIRPVRGSRRKVALAFGSLLAAAPGRLLLLGAAAAPTQASPEPTVQIEPLMGTVNPASAELITTAVAQAERAQRDALIIEIDTPGGLESSMRDMVKAI